MLICDYCGREKEDVKVYTAGGLVKNKEIEYRLRRRIETYGATQHIPGFPKLCDDCLKRIDLPSIIRGR